MNGFVLALLSLTAGVETTWEPTPQGDHVYVIQLDEQAIEALRAGHPITSVIPEGLNDVGAIRLQFGSSTLRRPALTLATPVDTGDGWQGNIGGTASLAALQTMSPADAFRASQSTPAPSFPNRSSPLPATTATNQGFAPQVLSNGQANPLAGNQARPQVDPETIQVPWEARMPAEVLAYQESPLFQGLPYGQAWPQTPAPTTPLPNNPPQQNWNPPNQIPSQFASNPSNGAASWDSGAGRQNDTFANFPRTTPAGNQATGFPLIGNGQTNFGTGAAGQPPALLPPGDGRGNWTNGWATNPQTPLNPSPNLGGAGTGFGVGQPSYPQSNLGLPNYAGTIPGYGQTGVGTGLGPVNPRSVSRAPSWVLDVTNPQNMQASNQAGAQLNQNLAQGNSSSVPNRNSTTTTRNVSNPSRTDSLSGAGPVGADETRGGLTGAGSENETEVQPTDSSVAALGLLFLSVGLNVYFGYLVRGFYLKTRQLARDLRESIVAS